MRLAITASSMVVCWSLIGTVAFAQPAPQSVASEALSEDDETIASDEEEFAPSDSRSIQSGGALPPAAEGQVSDFPYVDVEANCGKYTGNAIVSQCVRLEQHAYNLAKGRWYTFPPTERRNFKFWLNAGNHSGLKSPAFYQIIWEYIKAAEIQRERRKQDAAPPPKFRY